MRSEDIAPLLAAAASPGVGIRQGRIVSWDPETAENTVDVGGALLTNLPILNTNEALLLTAGAVVGILTSGSTWAILGRFTVPGTPEAASALDMVSSRIDADQVNGTVATTSTTFLNLDGPVVPDMMVGRSGKVLIIVSAAINYGTATSADIEGGEIGAAVTGATTLSANFTNAAETFNINTSSTRNGTLVRPVLLKGLNTGRHTFTHQVKTWQSGRTCNFSQRTLVVFAL